jgi:hypothetical protein
MSRLNPLNQTITVKGTLWYDHNSRTNSRIRLKKEIINKFPQIAQTQTKTGYEMILCPSYTELFKNLKTMETNNEPIPIIMFLMKEE